MTTNCAKLSTGTYKEIFLAIRITMQDLKHRVFKDQNRLSVPVMNLVHIAEMYVVQSSDNIRITSQGDYSLQLLAPQDFFHTKSTWEKMGIMKGRLPHLVRFDENGRKHEAYMTMIGLEIDPESQEFKRRMLNLSTYPATLIHETLEVVASVYKK